MKGTTQVEATDIKITAATREYFESLIEDAPHWSGTPLVGGNTASTRQIAGWLTSLKKLGLLETFESDGDKWVQFTAKGIEYANAIGWVGDPNSFHRMTTDELVEAAKVANAQLAEAKATVAAAKERPHFRVEILLRDAEAVAGEEATGLVMAIAKTYRHIANVREAAQAFLAKHDVVMGAMVITRYPTEDLTEIGIIHEVVLTDR